MNTVTFVNNTDDDIVIARKSNEERIIVKEHSQLDYELGEFENENFSVRTYNEPIGVVKKFFGAILSIIVAVFLFFLEFAEYKKIDRFMEFPVLFSLNKDMLASKNTIEICKPNKLLHAYSVKINDAFLELYPEITEKEMKLQKKEYIKSLVYMVLVPVAIYISFMILALVKGNYFGFAWLFFLFACFALYTGNEIKKNKAIINEITEKYR